VKVGFIGAGTVARTFGRHLITAGHNGGAGPAKPEKANENVYGGRTVLGFCDGQHEFSTDDEVRFTHNH
jgi:3-hydroxyisobutyrate dehydrogenase-like beta-hydroxyacid dehydrogenase